MVLLTVADDASQGVSFKVKLDVHVLPLKPKSNRWCRHVFLIYIQKQHSEVIFMRLAQVYSLNLSLWALTQQSSVDLPPLCSSTLPTSSWMTKTNHLYSFCLKLGCKNKALQISISEPPLMY